MTVWEPVSTAVGRHEAGGGVVRRAAVLPALLLPVVACGRGGEAPAGGGGGLSGGAVAASLEASGLPAESVVVHTAATDPEGRLGQPGGYVAKVTWRDARVPSGGPRGEVALEIFRETETMRRRAGELNAGAAADPARLQYLYYSEERRAILRVPLELTAEQANAYRAWLERL